MCALKQNHREKSEVSLLQTIPMWLHRTNNNKRSSHVSPKSMEAKFEVPGMVFQQMAGNATHLICLQAFLEAVPPCPSVQSLLLPPALLCKPNAAGFNNQPEKCGPGPRGAVACRAQRGTRELASEAERAHGAKWGLQIFGFRIPGAIRFPERLASGRLCHSGRALGRRRVGQAVAAGGWAVSVSVGGSLARAAVRLTARRRLWRSSG